MNVIDRAQAPTPKFFKTLRSVGLVIAAAGAAILTAPVALPAAIVTVGGYRGRQRFVRHQPSNGGR